MPKTEFISQAELAAVLESYNDMRHVIIDIRRRIQDGAPVETGIYTADSNPGDSISGYDRAMNGTSLFGLDLETKGLPSDVYVEAAATIEPVAELPKLPDWVCYEPLADFRLIAWDSDERSVDILLTSREFSALKEHLAKMRGYDVPEKTWHHIAEAVNAN